MAFQSCACPDYFSVKMSDITTLYNYCMDEKSDHKVAYTVI